MDRDLTKSVRDDDERELTELEVIRTVAVGMVDHPANATPFLILKRQEPEANNYPRLKYRSTKVKKQAGLEPSDIMSREELRDLRKKRSQEFGIEELEDGALTFPAGYPTDLKRYGDPVNLAYPIDTKDRAANARVRFKQNALTTYKEVGSRRVIHERIVSAELDFGIEPDYDPEDELDKLLPADIKDQLLKENKAMTPTEMIDALLATMTVGEPISEEMIAMLNKIREAVAPAEPQAPEQTAPEQASQASAETAPAEKTEGEGPAEVSVKISDVREVARAILYRALEQIERGALDSDQDKAAVVQVISLVREQVGASIDGAQEPAASSAESATEKAGRPQLSRARVALLRQTKELLEQLLSEAEPAPAGSLPEEKAQKVVVPDQESAVLKAQEAEVAALKKKIAELERRAAPSRLAPTEGSLYRIPEKTEPKKPLWMDVNAGR